MKTKDTTEEMYFVGHYRNSPTLQIFFTKEDAGRSDFESFSVYNCYGLWIGAYKKLMMLLLTLLDRTRHVRISF